MNAGETGISLKPYLLAVQKCCESLSKQELVETLLDLAREVPANSRRTFLDKLHIPSAGDVSGEVDNPLAVESQLLERIADLQEEIETRIASLEDGSYWDDYDRDEWRDEEPDYITEGQSNDMEQLLLDTGDLFMGGHLEPAKRVYCALFGLLESNAELSDHISLTSLNLREARARYCRCVYETADSARLLNDFFESMAVDAPMNTYRLELSSESFPLLRDVVDASVENLDTVESFLPAWEKKLSLCKGARAEVLRMEALQWMEGEAGISRLAREWKSEQPRGYLFWIQHLEAFENWQRVRDVCLEAKDVLAHGSFREQAMQYLVKAAKILGDKTLVLLGKRERFLSEPKQNTLLEFLQEAEGQNLRSQELDGILACKDQLNIRGDGGLYLEILLMAGRFEEAFEAGKTEKSLGWSYGKAGLLFACILSVLTDHSHKAATIQALFKKYAQDNYNEMMKGLKSVSLTESKKQQYLIWADTICRERVEQIVSQQHRNAYDRAAGSLGALAECYVYIQKKDDAISLVSEFVRTKFPRHSAFRAEVKKVVAGSALLKGFLV
jgi:hypothetical protein